jgi:hypothetical protein
MGDILPPLAFEDTYEPTDDEIQEAASYGVSRLNTPWLDGDWGCPVCKHHNYATNPFCQAPVNPPCRGELRDKFPVHGPNKAMKKKLRGGEWLCLYPKCNQMNFERQTECYRCKIPRVLHTISKDELRARMARCLEANRNSGQPNGRGFDQVFTH